MLYPRKIAIGFQEGTCPLHCTKCFAFGKNARGQKKAVKMPLEKAIQLIDEVARMEILPSIQPHIYTEPFANKDLFTIIEACVHRNICMSIITNGVLLEGNQLDFLISKLDRRYTISFSLDAITQQTYEKVRGDYSLEELEEKVKYLMHGRKEYGPRVGVNFSIEEDNYQEADDFVEKWKYKVDAVRINTAYNQEKKIPDRFRKEDDDKHSKCGYLEEVMTIDANGEVRACQFDAFGDTKLGNVFEESILNIWNGEKMSELRKRQRIGKDALDKHDFCYGCEVPRMTKYETDETDDFIIKRAVHSLYYNYRGENV